MILTLIQSHNKSIILCLMVCWFLMNPISRAEHRSFFPHSTRQWFLKTFRIKETMISETFEAKMHKNEEVNVLEFQPNFPTSFWIRTILLGIILVPLRLFLLGINVFTQWLCALFAKYIGIGHGKGLCFYMVEWMLILTRLSLYSVGMMVSVEGVKSEDAPIVLLGPHTTFFDAWLTAMIKPRAVVVIAEFQRRIPFLGELLNHKYR